MQAFEYEYNVYSVSVARLARCKDQRARSRRIGIVDNAPLMRTLSRPAAAAAVFTPDCINVTTEHNRVCSGSFACVRNSHQPRSDSTSSPLCSGNSSSPETSGLITYDFTADQE